MSLSSQWGKGDVGFLSCWPLFRCCGFARKQCSQSVPVRECRWPAAGVDGQHIRIVEDRRSFRPLPPYRAGFSFLLTGQLAYDIS
eukprot:19642_4